MKISASKVKNSLFDHFSSIGMNFDVKGYVKSLEANLVMLFPNWLDIKKELGDGQGGELKPDTNGVIKFQATHSSSALCVNNFASFKENLNHISFLGQHNFTNAKFEKKLGTGISTPNLDFFLENDQSIIGVESKFLEPLGPKLPNYDGNLAKYQNRKELDYLPDGFLELIEKYVASKDKLHLDVSQLIKHSIGILKASKAKNIGNPNSPIFKPILAYIYWVPINWYHFEVYRKHEDEIARFKKDLDAFLSFIPLNYQQFWNYYENDDLLLDSIMMCKRRYNIELS